MAEKHLISNLDLSDYETEDRGSTIDRLAGSVELYLEKRYPTTEGYKHKRSQFKPYPKHSHLVGTHLIVQRGSTWGYAVIFKPLDIENQTVSVTLKTAPKLIDIVGLAALPPVVLLAAWLLTTGRVEIDFNRDKDAVEHLIFGFIGLVCAWAVLFGILWVIAKPVMLKTADNEAQVIERRDLSGELHDLLVKPVSD